MNDEIVHGVNCDKVVHVAWGYHHHDSYDGPYVVDEIQYCGRCHGCLAVWPRMRRRSQDRYR